MFRANLLLLCFGLLVSFTCFPQSKKINEVASQVSLVDLKTNLNYLCSEQLEGRLVGTKGDSLAAAFIAGWFQKHNPKAPYNNGKSFIQYAELKKSVLEEGILTINGIKHLHRDGWGIWPQRFPANINMNHIPVVFLGYGHVNAYRDDLKGLDIKDKAVIRFASQIKDSTGNFISSGTKIPIAYQPSQLQKKGAALIFTPDPEREGLQKTKSVGPTNPFHGPNLRMRWPIGDIIINNKLMNELLSNDNVSIEELAGNKNAEIKPFQAKNSISLKVAIKEEEVKAPNVIGFIEGTDTSAGHILIMAHHDHDGPTEEGVRYGAVDNASGTVALMEIASLMNKAAKKGIRPRRSIVFFSTTGEEVGLLGSYYYVDHPVFPLQKAWALVNIDMVGYKDDSVFAVQGNKDYVYLFLIDSLNHGLEMAMNAANEFVQLKIDRSFENPSELPNKVRASDQYPFYLKGVPIVKFNGGHYKYYHEPTDTPDKVNFDILKKQTQLAFLIAWNLANN
jgi:Peptidase family M28